MKFGQLCCDCKSKSRVDCNVVGYSNMEKQLQVAVQSLSVTAT